MFPSLGRPDHAGPAADPRTDRHVAPGAATEHPHPQRADSENSRSAVRIQLMKAFKKAKNFFFFINVITSNVSIPGKEIRGILILSQNKSSYPFYSLL